MIAMTIFRSAIFRFVVSAVVAGTSTSIFAQALYDAPPPPGSTFIRVSNGTAVAGVVARVGTQTLPALPPFATSTYLFLQPGEVELTVGERSATHSLAADHYYTAALTTDGVKLFDLKGFSSQLKSMIILYNLLPDATLSLKTADGKTTVFADVAPYSAVQREINPLTVQFALFRGDQKFADVPAKSFDRGQPSSLMVAGTTAAPTLVWEVPQ